MKDITPSLVNHEHIRRHCQPTSYLLQDALGTTTAHTLSITTIKIASHKEASMNATKEDSVIHGRQSQGELHRVHVAVRRHCRLPGYFGRTDTPGNIDTVSWTKYHPLEAVELP